MSPNIEVTQKAAFRHRKRITALATLPRCQRFQCLLQLCIIFADQQREIADSDLCFSITPIQGDGDYDGQRQQNLTKQ
ncbi:hypothetical protein [Xenorhabdus sp. BG5]|uniref:hypothetical protein n=1 Tax=Xenorhabdus sp. BG5 TaxID=2782014 RepID=UPI00187E2517|nr:hypothetical protein [Xenorhabdus sp. BG5]MBE8595267.1 hypothetical protein [Xenorhabdus sp. BG5]